MRVLLAMREEEKRERFKLLLESERSDCCVSCAGDGRQALALIHAFAPDILFLDEILPLLDGQAVLEALKGTGLSCPPKVVFLTTPCGGESCAAAAWTDICLPSSSGFDLLLHAADAACDKLQGTLASLGSATRSMLIQNHFDALGMPVKLSGRTYLAYLLDLTVPSPGLMDALTTRLYPAAAERYETTSQAIERCIRHAIEATWSRGDMIALERLFGLSIDPDRGKPTNREFLAMSAQHLRLLYAGQNRS